MPARLRLPLALLLCALATAALSLTLWRAENDDVRDEARERARGTAAALEQRAGAAVLALQGIRAAYDASPSVGPQAFSTYALDRLWALGALDAADVRATSVD